MPIQPDPMMAPMGPVPPADPTFTGGAVKRGRSKKHGKKRRHSGGRKRR